MGPTDCSETSVRNYHYWLRNSPRKAQFSSVSRRKFEITERLSESKKGSLNLCSPGFVKVGAKRYLTQNQMCFSSIVRQMPGLNSQSRGTDRISSELSFVLCLSLCYAMVFMLFCCYYVVLLLCCSVIICVVLCIDRVYCTWK